LGGTTTVDGHLLPSKDAVDTNGGEWNIGSSSLRWHTAYIKNLNISGTISTSGAIGITNTADGITGSSNNG
jgi:hypothetical protein